MFLELLLAGGVAALLTLFDLDRTFYIPQQVGRKIALRCWFWGFIVANGLFAGFLNISLATLEPFSTWNPWYRSIAIGLGYLAIMRQKFSTFELDGKEVPFGFELFYEQGKHFFFRRINRIAMDARFHETVELANVEELAELVSRAKLTVRQDALMNEDDRQRALAWIDKTEGDTGSLEIDRKRALADAILSGKLGKPE